MWVNLTRFSIRSWPRTAGRPLDASRAAVADGCLAVLDDGRNLPNPAVELKHLFELGLVGLHVVVGDRPFFLVRLQRIVGEGSARLAVDYNLAHSVSPLRIEPK